MSARAFSPPVRLPMPHQLAPQVHACVLSDQAIFLDVGRDRYLTVGGRMAQAVAAFLEDRPACPADLDRLVAAGLMEPAGAAARPPPRQALAPARSLIEAAGLRPCREPRDLLEVAIGLGKARRTLRRRPLAQVLEDLDEPGQGEPAGAKAVTNDLLEAAARFNAARRQLPFKPNCLPDSLALLACLTRRGHAADLVFGVKLHPFSAHCWVQAGDVVLNDALDHATLHTPILVR